MKAWLTAAVVLVAAVLQVATLPAWRPLGVIPNLLLVILLLCAIYRPATQALGLTVVVALLVDLASATTFGLRLSFFTLMVLIVVALMRLGADFERLDLLLLAVVVGTIGFNLAILSSVWPVTSSDYLVAARLILVEMIINALLAWGLSLALVPILGERSLEVVSPSQRRSRGKI